MAFTVDPLFQQTSAQFDEGGAKGLLLNTLSVYQGCEIVCDSWEVLEKSMSVKAKDDTERQASINLSFMKGKSSRPFCMTRLQRLVHLCEIALVLIDS